MGSIYIYSPSGAVRDRAGFRRGVRRLEKLGHAVTVDPDALTRHMRFAGTGDTRLAAVARAAASGCDIALISRGGYGLTPLLPRLPYDALAQAVRRGTRFVGLSDFTALQLALLKETGAITWAGPALIESFGRLPGEGENCDDVPDPIMLDCFSDLCSGVGEGCGWRLPPDERRLFSGETLLTEDAVLWGGNLSVLTALIGTPWLPEIEGGVLFLEDVNEPPYRIERMLTQLLQAGILNRQRAVLLGQFTGFKLTPQDAGFNLKKVVARLRENLSVPLLTGLPFGHVPTKVLLPVGAKVHLSVRGGEALILW